MGKAVAYKDKYLISYAEYGNLSGFPVLVQHGMIASIRDYQLFDRLIRAGIRLITIARPGYGDSSPYIMKNIAEWGEMVESLVELLHLSQIDVFGVSSGAPYSYSIGYRLPNKVRHVFILSGTPALYDDGIAALWPYPLHRHSSINELQLLARELFFS